MKRTLILLAALAVAATPAVGHAAPPKKPKKTVRTVTFDYTLFCGLHVSAVASTVPGACADTGTVTIQATKAEKYVTFSTVDQSGTSVGLQYWKNDDYNGTVLYTCDKGSSKNTKGGGTYTFSISLSPDCQGVPLGGTLTVKLSNLP